MSFVQVRPRSGSSQSLATDRTPFYGARVPDEVKIMLKALKSVNPATVKKILKLVVQGLEDNTLETDALLSVDPEKLHEEDVRVVYSGLLVILKLALKQKTLKQEMLKEDLSQLKMSPELITDINSIVFGKRRPRLEESFTEHAIRLPHLDSLKWRVDVTISNSTLNRVLEPSILLEMTLSNGSVKTFEVSVARFHELRYNVAYVLKEMEDLEKRNILKD